MKNYEATTMVMGEAMINYNDPSSLQNRISSFENIVPMSNSGFAPSIAPPPANSVAPAAPILNSATATTTITSSNASTVAAITTATRMNASTGSTLVPSWVSSLSDLALKSDMTAMNGNVTEAGLAKMMADLDNELTTKKTTLSAGQFNDLQTIAMDLNIGETDSTYESYVMNALVNGNAANATWTGGAASSSILGNLTTGSSAAQLSELTGKWLLGTDLASNKVTVEGSSFTVSYIQSSAPLFGTNGPSMSDINQGQLADCYLLSSLAEVASQNSSIIKNMITDNGNGTYGVNFHVNGQNEYVTVNNSLQNDCNTGANIWGSVLEKAYTELQTINLDTGNAVNYGNSFSTVGNCGTPSAALEAITGASQITYFYANGTSWAGSICNSSLVQTSYTSGISTASLLSTLKSDISKGDDLVLTSRTWSYDSTGKVELVANHAMSIYGIDSSNGNLEIRNPWGTESGQYWDTTFEVSLSTLLSNGDVITADNAGTGITISAPVIANQTGNQTPAANRAFSISLGNVFTDPQSGVLTYNVTLANGQSLPSWLSFNAQTGTLSGTTPLTSATEQVLVTATDTSGLSATENFTISDTALTPTLANATPTETVTSGKSFSFILPSTTFVDPQGETLSYLTTLSNGQALPSWLTFNTKTQTFSGTAPTSAQSLSLSVTATNQANLSTKEAFSLSVAQPGPQIGTAITSQSWTDGQKNTFSLPSGAFTDTSSKTINYSYTGTNGASLPSWLTFNSQTGVLTGTPPTSSAAQSLSLKVAATDSNKNTVSESFTITCNPAKPDPKTGLVKLANPTPNQSWIYNQTKTLAIPSKTFSDSAGNSMTYVAMNVGGNVNSTKFLTFNEQTGTFSGAAPASTSGTSVVEVVAVDNVTGSFAAEVFGLNFTSSTAKVSGSSVTTAGTLQSNVQSLVSAISSFGTTSTSSAATASLGKLSTGNSTVNAASALATSIGSMTNLLSQFNSNGQAHGGALNQIANTATLLTSSAINAVQNHGILAISGARA